MARTQIRIDRTSDKTSDNGDRTRTYDVLIDGNVVGHVDEHWHASAFDNGVVDMSLYKGSTDNGMRTLSARVGKTHIDGQRTRALTVAAVRKHVIGK